jgi:hypothetical protein
MTESQDRLYRAVRALAGVSHLLRQQGLRTAANDLDQSADAIISRVDKERIDRWMLGSFLPSYDHDERLLHMTYYRGGLEGIGQVRVVPGRNSLDLLVVTLLPKDGEPEVLIYPHRLADRPHRVVVAAANLTRSVTDLTALTQG